MIESLYSFLSFLIFLGIWYKIYKHEVLVKLRDKEHDLIICQQNDQVDLVDKTSKESFEKLFTKTRERAEYKDYQVMDFVKRIVNHTTEKLVGDNARNHNKCYANLCKYK